MLVWVGGVRVVIKYRSDKNIWRHVNLTFRWSGLDMLFFFFFKQKTAYEMQRGLVGSEMCIRDSFLSNLGNRIRNDILVSSLFLFYRTFYLFFLFGYGRKIQAIPKNLLKSQMR
eukprot:TRINITY_DN3151_c0_g1_i4.p2 TRINITY_DN3151_c0_g1~~TRINITY_DN3151_c0_g1_i4.p2  ORF type:complete len:114 (+),score=9.49 TRINITY_DN3151_c0_g1_i4:3-344(+)